MRRVYIVGSGQVPVQRRHRRPLTELGVLAIHAAVTDAGHPSIDALYLANMLSDELQGQKHMAALVTDAAGLDGIEAWQVRAATASGAAALRAAYLAVASGAIETAVAVGVEKMSDGVPTAALAKALDARREIPTGATILSQNAYLMQTYLARYNLPTDSLAYFAVNAHLNAVDNPYACFPDRPVSLADVNASRFIIPPLRLYDAAPICDGAAAVIVSAQSGPAAVEITASAAATDRFRLAERPDPLDFRAARLAIGRAYAQAGVAPAAIDLFELHDAFSIIACLLLEAGGFAEPGEGWRLATAEGIGRNGRIPIATLGGLKARGHPIGATPLYQAVEARRQLTDLAGPAQVQGARHALLASVGGIGPTAFAHIISRPRT